MYLSEIYSERNHKMIKMYKVGGCVRDKLLGIPSKDIDYAVEAPSFLDMYEHIEKIGKIYLSSLEYYTIRAKVNSEDADFVLCRKEGPYSDGRHPDWVELGTLYDDLSRRDFTINAMAEDENGNIIDPHWGQDDLKRRILRCVGNTKDRLNEDPLRLLRALRFNITKGFRFHKDIWQAMSDQDIIWKLVETVSHERIREEMRKCFAHNTYHTLQMLNVYTELQCALFRDNPIMWLEPTNKGR